MIRTDSTPAPASKINGLLQTHCSSPGVGDMSGCETTNSSTRIRRLLVPINALEDSRWGVQYALRLHQEGIQVEVILLNVGEPITQWQVLRFRTQQEIAQFQSERAQAFIEEASQPLDAAGIQCRGVFRQGELVFSILDVAEALDCDEIIMPTPCRGILDFFSCDTVSAVRKQQRGIPVVIVDSQGNIQKPH